MKIKQGKKFKVKPRALQARIKLIFAQTLKEPINKEDLKILFIYLGSFLFKKNLYVEFKTNGARIESGEGNYLGAIPYNFVSKVDMLEFFHPTELTHYKSKRKK